MTAPAAVPPAAVPPAAVPPTARPGPAALPGTGVEWVVEAFGADVERLTSVEALAAMVDAMVGALGLTPVGDARWHRFPASGAAAGTAVGGVTGLVLLAESHLAVHTFPEHGSLCLNLFCCAPRPEWDFAAGLAAAVGAERVRVRRVTRPYAPTV